MEETRAVEQSASSFGQADDAVFEALWTRVLEAWSDERTHTAFLDHAIRIQKLSEAAARYRTLKDDPEKGPLAVKKMGAILLAAENMLLASRSKGRGTLPVPVTAGAIFVILACFGFVAYWMYQSQGSAP